MEDLDCHRRQDSETPKRHRQLGLLRLPPRLPCSSAVTPSLGPPCSFFPCIYLLVPSGTCASSAKAEPALHRLLQNSRGVLKLITLVTETILGDGFFIEILLL